MRFVIAVAIALPAASCNFLGSMSEIQSQANATAAALERDLGTRPSVGWNWNNGQLRSVSLVFDGQKVANLQIGQLEARVQMAVTANFKQRPSTIEVVTSWSN
jgi:hypothetical protein